MASLTQALFDRTRLVEKAPPLSSRTKARGAGSSAPLVGTGRDNATDLLDRRVEFEPFTDSFTCSGAVRADTGMQDRAGRSVA